jgi:ATP-dependent Lon protease
MHPQSGEATIARTYLEWIADLPWGEQRRPPTSSISPRARELLETHHYGLEKVKKRCSSTSASASWRPTSAARSSASPGPPGVGKTSLGRSIAEALGRQYVRISLGGVRDDAEIRGHRRTYIGALPGRFIQAMKRAGTSNPVIVLDEVDKLVGANLRGDPAAALLEALDPEQNAAFHDHYLDLDYDLSKVIFLCTANELGAIPDVLRDRLEVIPLSGYTVEEKLAIARHHLLPKQRIENGLENVELEIPDEVLLQLATEYTRESGVRNLERELAALLRDVAMHLAEGRLPRRQLDPEEVLRILGPPRYYDEMAAKVPTPGVVTGLGWTPVGGTLLFVEASVHPGTGQTPPHRQARRCHEGVRPGRAQLCAQPRRRIRDLADLHGGLLKDHDLHLHFPAGAVPKDGPSAGIAVVTALISLFTDRPARADIAMTGEITLRGQVLPDRRRSARRSSPPTAPASATSSCPTATARTSPRSPSEPSPTSPFTTSPRSARSSRSSCCRRTIWRRQSDRAPANQPSRSQLRPRAPPRGAQAAPSPAPSSLHRPPRSANHGKGKPAPPGSPSPCNRGGYTPTTAPTPRPR